MAKKMMYSFEEKKTPTDAVVSTIMGIVALVLFLAAVYASYYMRGHAGLVAGALGASGILFSFVGFILGIKSFSGKNMKYKYSKIGSILSGIMFVVWLGVTLSGA